MGDGVGRATDRSAAGGFRRGGDGMVKGGFDNVRRHAGTGGKGRIAAVMRGQGVTADGQGRSRAGGGAGGQNDGAATGENHAIVLERYRARRRTARAADRGGQGDGLAWDRGIGRTGQGGRRRSVDGDVDRRRRCAAGGTRAGHGVSGRDLGRGRVSADHAGCAAQAQTGGQCRADGVADRAAKAGRGVGRRGGDRATDRASNGLGGWRQGRLANAEDQTAAGGDEIGITAIGSREGNIAGAGVTERATAAAVTQGGRATPVAAADPDPPRRYGGGAARGG